MEQDCPIVSNPNAKMCEVQMSEITFPEASSTPVVKEKFVMEGCHKVNKVAPGPTKVYIAFIILISLVVALFLAVIILIVAIAIELPKLKSETDSADQQSSISTLTNSAAEQQSSVSALMNRLDSLNSSTDQLSQQLLQAIDSQTQEVASLLIQQVNSSLEALSQQLLQDISEIDNRTQKINSSLELFSQQLIQDISALESRVEQVNSSQQMISQQVFEGITALNTSFSQRLLQDVSIIDSRIDQVNSSQTMISQQLLQDISAVDSRTREINSSFSQRLLQDVSIIDSRIDQVNSSQTVISQQLLQDISAVDSRTREINSSFSQQLLQDVSAIGSRIEQVNSTQQVLSQQLQQDISAVDSRIFQNQQNISALENSIEQVNISLLEQVNEVQTQAQETVDNLEVLGEFPTFPASSCAAILSSLPSGFYYVRNSTGSAVRVYCDMTLSCGGVTGGWMRVVDVDFNDSSNVCPSGFREDIDSDIRTCVKGDDAGGCTSIEYSASDVTYSRVCGKVIAYQFGTTEAFSRLIVISSLTVDSQYLDGISLTHGNPREHIWSFAMGVTESRTDRFACPCNIGSTISVMNTFIGTNYFCDSAASDIVSGMRYPNNPLFDGVGCDAMTNQCCSFNNPPWFYRQLPQSTADDLEIRACRDEPGMNENSLIQSIALYVR